MKILLKYFIVLLVFFLSAACASLNAKNTERLEVLKAFYFENNAKFDASKKILLNLYRKTGHKIYLKESIKIAFLTKSSDFSALLNEGKKVLSKDNDFMRILISDMIFKRQLKSAKIELEKLIKRDKNSKNYSMLASLYLYEKNYIQAISYFKKAYALENDEKTALIIADLYENKLFDTKNAINFLQNTLKNEKSPVLLENLAILYIKNNEQEKAIKIYENLYKNELDERYFDAIVQIFAIEREFEKAIVYMNKNFPNSAVIADLYATLNQFDKAYEFCKNQYNQSANPIFLAKMAIYEYEKNGKKTDKKTLQNVLKNFENSVFLVDEALYYNYYGYLLIDHDLDIQKGINLVQKALKIEPNSPFYIDSLAWGYYKLNRCKEANELIKSIQNAKDFLNTKEAKEHILAIKQCLAK